MDFLQRIGVAAVELARNIASMLRFLIILGVSFPGGLLGSGGLILFGLQVFWWLQSGYWTPFPLFDVVVAYGPRSLANWLTDPTSWLGLHRIIAFVLDVSLALTMIVVGGVLELIGHIIEDGY
jgi:hypothetical protein